MQKLVFAILFIILLFFNCTQQSGNLFSEKIDGKKLNLLVKGALSGNEASNFKLSGLLVDYTPSNVEYNQLFIDSTFTASGLKLFSVLVEFPNPLFNILAVYDENLNLYLQDNSLNGNIAVKWKTISGKQYLAASERFTAKDKIELSRLSLYSVEDSKVTLLFRSFTRIKDARKKSEQIINYVGNDKITTRITSNHNRKLNNKTVTFNYSNVDNKYVSKDDIFHNFILDEINKAKGETKNQTLSKETVEQIKVELKLANRQGGEYLVEELRGFQIVLDSDWYDPISLSVTEHLIKPLQGIRYVNNSLGAQITVFRLPKGDDATQFIEYKFGDATEGSYSIRSSELITLDKHVVQILEHSCLDKRFLLILQVPKLTYEKNKNMYSDILTTFSINC
jgi:hypothetical protein